MADAIKWKRVENRRNHKNGRIVSCPPLDFLGEFRNLCGSLETILTAMNRLHEIRLIAAYETKGIVRDVTFWIIALVILAGCPLFYMWLTRPEQLEGEWIYTSSSSSIPYALMQTFNFLQTLLTLFVGTGFLWRAKNAQAMESLQTRVYTNGEWFAGKGLALAAAAFGLQCAVMMAAVILQIDAG